MRKFLLLTTLLVALVGYVKAQTDSVVVNFEIDMKAFADTSSDFDPTADSVYISGSLFESEWPQPGTNMDAMLTDADNDSIYKFSHKLHKDSVAKKTYEYKFFYVPAGMGSSWDYGEWSGYGNRRLALNGLADTVTIYETFALQEVMVTFNVNMKRFVDTTTEFDLANDTVYISGNVLDSDWSEPGTNKNAIMTDTDGDTTYTWVTTLPKDSTYEYKFFYVPAGTGSSWSYGEWDGGNNRVAEIGMADTTLNKYWNAFVTMFNVTDGTDPVEGASVAFADTSLMTDAEGMVWYTLPNGDYDYTVTADGYEDATGSFTIDYGKDTVDVALTAVDTSDGTGINDLNEIANVKVYPNPTNGYITISGNKIEGATVEIINTLGARMRKIQVVGDKQHIDLNELNSGVYFLRIEKGNRRGTQKIIIE
jgi:hypothetical protein